MMRVLLIATAIGRVVAARIGVAQIVAVVGTQGA